MSGPIKHNTTGLWVERGKKTQLRGQRRADFCIFMWLEGSMTAVSENCEQRQNGLYGKRQPKKVSFFF